LGLGRSPTLLPLGSIPFQRATFSSSSILYYPVAGRRSTSVGDGGSAPGAGGPASCRADPERHTRNGGQRMRGAPAVHGDLHHPVAPDIHDGPARGGVPKRPGRDGPERGRGGLDNEAGPTRKLREQGAGDAGDEVPKAVDPQPFAHERAPVPASAGKRQPDGPHP